LYRSIDQFVFFPGSFKVYGVAPRSRQKPSPSARAEAKGLNVEYIDENLNSEFHYYPLANKPLSCAHVVDAAPVGPYLFLDSDTLFLNDTNLGDLAETQISLRPVDTPNIGVSTFDEPNGPCWRALYTKLGVKEPRLIAPGVTPKEIFEYYNSGFVYVENGNIIRQWRSVFESLMRNSIRPNEGIFFVEQSALSGGVAASKVNVFVPPNDINYPVHLHHKLLPGTKIEDPRTIRHIHYHHIFQDPSDRRQCLSDLGFGDKIESILKMLEWPRP